MKLARYDGIARYIAEREGRPCSPRTARRYCTVFDPPLPTRLSGRIRVAESEAVDQWLAATFGADSARAA